MNMEAKELVATLRGIVNGDVLWTRDVVRAAADLIERQQATLDHLPKTKDGVPYAWRSDVELWYIANDDKVYCHTPWEPSDISGMFSTREAAEKARQP
jgi:hypothetical protein